MGTLGSTPIVERAPDAVELREAALKTRLLTERDVSAAQSRPAKSGEELDLGLATPILVLR